LAILFATIETGLASDLGPVIVIPGRPGVPIMINGVDASYSIVEGDWGLAKGIHVQPTVYGGRIIDLDPHVGHYYPSSGKVPGYGYGGCGGCGWLGYERLPDPAMQYHSRVVGSPQYYYVNQGPTYTGPGNFAPYRYYEESAISGWGPHRYASRRHRGRVVRSL